MKRIVAFVFLGILIYAGGFVLVYGVKDYLVSLNTPAYLHEPLQNGIPVADKVSGHNGVLTKKDGRAKLFGIPIGEKKTTYLYIVPVGEKPNYMLLGVTDPEDIEALENTLNGGEFEFTGVAQSMDPILSKQLRNFLKNRPGLIGADDKVVGVETIAANHIMNYTVYVQDITKPDASAIIAGAVIIIVGVGLTALLIVKIIREKTGY